MVRVASAFVANGGSTFFSRATPSRAISPLRMATDGAPVCLVTGASRGLGRAIAINLGSAGCSVVVNYAGSKDKAEAVVEEVKAAGGDAVAIQADCSDPVAIAEMFNAATEAFGPPDVIVNNAGITKDGLVMRMKPDQWQSVIDINLSGVFYTSQAFF